MFKSSVITISRSAYANNLSFLRKQLNGSRLCSVVKGNAYGHGLLPFVPMAVEAGVDYFAVYSADEAYTLVSSISNDADLFIMGMVEGDALAWAIEHGVECCIYDMDRLDQALKLAQKIGRPARIHVELETGMHRTGFQEAALPAVIERLVKHAEQIDLIGLFTHFAGSESRANDPRVLQQIERFTNAKRIFAQHGLVPKYAHQACSAAMMNFPDTVDGMARIGIMQYGFWPNQETWFRHSSANEETEDPLRRLISWKSHVMAVTHVKTGEEIGYGSSCNALRDMTVAVIPVGYAHGFDRGLSNTGKVLIRGGRASVTGIVNMNAISVDVTDLPGVEKGDEVVLIGRQGESDITVSSFSEMSEQLNYEMLTRLPRDIPRVIVD